jgi:hypothetical protein
LGGAPLDGERHIWWNFVSSSKDRIEQANYQYPGPGFAGIGDNSAEASYYTWVDQHNTLGLGNDVPISTGNESDALLALVDGKYPPASTAPRAREGIKTHAYDGCIPGLRHGFSLLSFQPMVT